MNSQGRTMTGPLQQFVIQEHTTPAGVHWDLMLQINDILWTWRLPIPPEQLSSETVIAERIFNHPLRFLSYEGPVQDKTGSVQIADHGKYILENKTEGKLEIDFKGKLLTGRYTLTQQNGHRWLLSALPTV
jgi:bifunctional non-homologous end joining protein LigD